MDCDLEQEIACPQLSHRFCKEFLINSIMESSSDKNTDFLSGDTLMSIVPKIIG